MDFRTGILKNGTRLVLVPHADTMAATVLVLYGVGSRYESAQMNGAAHYIEHMMFKGTKRRKDTMAISRDLDGVGADYNAFTGKDYTGQTTVKKNNGSKDVTSVLLAPVAVTKDNVKDTVIKDGFYTVAQICTAAYAQACAAAGVS